MPSQAIWFGVLHLNAAAMLLTCLLRPLLQACPAGPGWAACAALFALTNQLPYGYLGFEGLRLVARAGKFVPRQPVLAGSAGSDEVFLGRLLPAAAVAVFVLGRVVFGAAVAAARRARPGRRCARWRLRGGTRWPVYMAHQPVLYGALWLWHALCR